MVVFVLDVTQGVAFVEKQVQLFNSLKPFFASKSVVLGLSKCDLWTPESLSEQEVQLIQSLTAFPFVDTVSIAATQHISAGEFRQAAAQGGLAAAQAMQAQRQENERVKAILERGAAPLLAFSSVQRSGNERVFNVAADLLLGQRAA